MQGRPAISILRMRICLIREKIFHNRYVAIERCFVQRCLIQNGQERITA
jgi:hypothetical protein